MKMSFVFLLSLLFTFLSCGKENQVPNTGSQKDGHETGNGTDNKPFAGAWVLGENSEVTYCTVISPAFGVDPTTIHKEIEQAFKSWREYIIAKEINEAIEIKYLESMGRMPGPGPTPEEIARKKIFLLPIKSRLLSACNGTQNVTFYFGHVDSLITKLKRKYVNPTAFAERTSFDSKTGSGKGAIWLVKEGGLQDGKAGYPQWSLPNRLLGILLHEIGHIYGVGHVEETIMQEDLFHYLLSSDHTSSDQHNIEYKMAQIDHSKELFAPSDYKKQEYVGTITYPGPYTSEQDRQAGEETFEVFTNKKPVGKIIVKFTGGNLILQDEEDSFVFSFPVMSTHHTGDQGVFSVERSWDQLPGSSLVGMGIQLYHEEKLMVGEIVTKGGLKFPVIMEKNQGPPLTLKYLKDGEPHWLMLMDSFY